MRICCSVNIKESIHLSTALAFITIVFWVQICTLPFACEPIESASCCVSTCCFTCAILTHLQSCTFGLLNLSIVRIRVVVSVYCRIVTTCHWCSCCNNVRSPWRACVGHSRYSRLYRLRYPWILPLRLLRESVEEVECLSRFIPDWIPSIIVVGFFRRLFIR